MRRRSSRLVVLLMVLGVSSAASQQVLPQPTDLVAQAGVVLTSAPLRVIVTDANDAPVNNLAVRVTVPSAALDLRGAEATTNAQGIAVFTNLSFEGPPGDYRVVIRAGTETAEVPLRLRPGPPSRIEVLTQPPPKVHHDSVLAPARVRLTDALGNPISGKEIAVEVCHRPDLKYKKLSADRRKIFAGPDSTVGFVCGDRLNLAELRSTPGGTTVRTTDADGVAEFGDLTVRGDRGQYRLVFSHQTLRDTTDQMSYDPAEDYNHSYVMIAAIKSIAGAIPDNEFFALRFRFNFRKRPSPLGWAPSAVAGIDLALTNRDADSVSSPQKALTEAFLQMNLFSLLTMSTFHDVPQRTLVVGPQFRIFNSVPYLGLNLSALELGGSPFYGSQLAGGILWRFSDSTVVADGDTVHVPAKSLFADFNIASSTIDFFKTLNVRGGVLLPLEGKRRRVESRITIAVPVGTLRVF